MATKSYTDLEQSRKLAGILPNNSADMCWGIDDDIMRYGDKPYLNPYKNYTAKKYYIPCWSLASLVSILPVSCDDGQHCFALINCNPNGDTEWLCCYEDDNGNLLNECYADNPVDACVELILKLNEQNICNMDYKEKYNEALEMAREAFYSPETPHVAKAWLLTMFPALVENENEKIRRNIIELVKQSSEVLNKQNQNNMITWLEKQGRMLDPDKVIEWIDEHVPTKFEDMENYVQQFKKDFGL